MFICTLGEPLSINIEMISHFLSKEIKVFQKIPCLLIGSWHQWRWQLNALEIKLEHVDFMFLNRIVFLEKPGFYFYDIGGPYEDPRSLSVELRGKISVQALECLKQVSLGRRSAILTCPIDKFTCKQAGFSFPGQTEFFEQLGATSGIMILAGPKLRVGLATNHLAIKDIAYNLNIDLIVSKIKKFAASLKFFFDIPHPKIGVCGLNPHCGEQGLFGDEEETIILPAVKQCNLLDDFTVHGPLPADTAFWQASKGIYDGVLAMYHDQGLGPLKTLHFDNAINLTGGLPFLRVSPDHGPARDLFLTRKASPKSFEQSWSICINYLYKNL